MDNHDNEKTMVSDEEASDEVECHTDDEEELSHDHICCSACGTATHAALGKCSNTECGKEFKFSASGYLISGEDDGFICDEDDDAGSESGSSDDEMEYDYEDGEESSSDEESFVYDDEEEYVPKVDVVAEVDNLPKRVTRSTNRS